MGKTHDSSEPVFVTQLDPDSRPEKVDITKHSVRVYCAEPECYQIRYVLPQDKSQVDRCKPCARTARLKSRASRARINRQAKKPNQHGSR